MNLTRSLIDVLPQFVQAEFKRLERAKRQQQIGGGTWMGEIKFC